MKRPAVTPRWLLAALLAVVPPRGTSAQTKAIEFIKAVPDAPAFTFLSASPTKIERPGNLRDLGLALVSGIGEDGRAQQGFALDASVWNLIPGFDLPLPDYKNSFWKYALGNLQASIGAVRTAGDSSDMLAALGIKTVLLDRGDPMLSDSITTKLAAAIRSECAPDQPGAGQNVACVDSVIVDLVGTFTARNWNATQLAFATAFGANFQNGEFDRGRSGGLDAWIVGAVPFGTNIQLLGQATYKRRPEIDTVPKFTGLNVGARAIAGSATFTAFVEFAREWRSAKTDPTNALFIDKEVGGWSAGIEMRLVDNTWVSTGFGTQFNALSAADRSVMFVNVKWGLSSKTRIDKLRG